MPPQSSPVFEPRRRLNKYGKHSERPSGLGNATYSLEKRGIQGGSPTANAPALQGMVSVGLEARVCGMGAATWELGPDPVPEGRELQQG